MNFENGQIVYLKDGQQANYIQEVPGIGHVVQALFEYSDRDGMACEDIGPAIIVPEVFESTPTPVYDHRIKRLDERIRAMTREFQEIEAKLATSKEEMKSRRQELELHDALRNFVLFTQGKITHIVVDHGNYSLPRVLSWPEACTMEEWGRRQSPDLRLITVSGNCKNGTVSLKINQYSDGSGNRENDCFLCTSEEEAKERCRVLVDAYFEHARKIQGLPHCFERDLEQLKAWGIEVPTWLLRKHWTAVRDRATAEMNESVEKRDAALALSQQAEKALEDLPFETEDQP